MEGQETSVIVNIPFPTNRTAQIAYDVLRVDAEPKRSGIKKELSLEKNVLIGNFSGGNKQLRAGVNSFFDNVKLILQTIDFAGPPVGETYSYY